MNRNLILILIIGIIVGACSATKGISDDDQLFVGLKKINYQNYADTLDIVSTQEEVEAALATEPNGALFGSSYYRTPFVPGLWIWNAFSGKESGFAKWMTSTFGTPPVLMSWVNPDLRASVAQSVLRNHGFFHGRVNYETITQSNPKKAKIAYTVDMGHLFTIDTLQYVGFPVEADSLIRGTMDEAELHSGDAFAVSALDAERSRLSLLFRNNGYYFYQPGYASYLADTFALPGKVQLRLQMADGVPAEAKRKWYIGRVNINMRKSNERTRVYADSTVHRWLTVRYNSRKPPLRPRVIMADLKLRPRQLYSYDRYLESISKLNAMGLFSMIDMQFTPRDSSLTCDTLDLTLNCVFDKPYDFYVETNFNARTIGRMGPELKLGLTRRNAFRGGEKIDINLHGSYEWSTTVGDNMSNYEYGADAAIEFPRIVAPFFGGNRVRRDSQGHIIRRRQFYSTPTTIAKISADVVRRPGYYKMHVNSGEWTYRWQTSESSRHEFSPLTFKYQYINSSTEKFDSILNANPYLVATMEDYCIPEMRYTYLYTSPKSQLNPIRWETTIAEAGNLTSLAYMAIFGDKWNDKGKKLFRNPYSQFLRVETDFTKTWTLSSSSQLVGHVNAGVIYVFGNSDMSPFSERFYVGGASSVRAFGVREIGPGNFVPENNRQFAYLMQNGDVKFVANLEYRTRLFGNLHGAAFLDAGNVWNLDDDLENLEGLGSGDKIRFRLNRMFSQLAVGTGIGIRYDMEFLILRLDWGIALHVPYETGKSGFYNIDSFRRYQTLHFAIGYPF